MKLSKHKLKVKVLFFRQKFISNENFDSNTLASRSPAEIDSNSNGLKSGFGEVPVSFGPIAVFPMGW